MSAAVESTAAPVATTQAVPAAAPAAKVDYAKSNTSLYVGDLAPEVSEPVLFEHFSTAAPVSSVRVCRNALTRESLGYAYINFPTTADAEKALAELNYSVVKGRPCRIMFSQRDPAARRSNLGNVFVKNLASDITPRELHETFQIFGPILSCKVAMNPKGESKGYAFVHYETEESAKAAIAEVNGMEFNGRNVEVMPYVPKTQRSGPEWTNVFLKNLPKAWGDKELLDTVSPYGEIGSAVVMKDAATGASKGFGFVSFKSHVAATKAVEELNGKEVPGEPATLPPRAATTTAAPKAPKPASDKKEGDAAAKTADAAATPAEGEAAAAAEKKEAAPADAAATAEKKPSTVKLFASRAQKKQERERAIRAKIETSKRERISKMAGCNLYVRNLDESVDDAKLREVFGSFGTITSATIAREDGRSRLFGYVCFSAAEEASKALQAMHHKLVQGKPLFVSLWQSKEQRAANLSENERRRAAAAGASSAPRPNVQAPAGPGGAGPLGAMGGPGGPGGLAANNPMLMFMQQMLMLQGQQQFAQGGVAPNPVQMQAMAQFIQNLSQMQQANSQRGNAPFLQAGGVPQQQQQRGPAVAGARGGPQQQQQQQLAAPGFPGVNPMQMAAMLGQFNPAAFAQQQQQVAAQQAQAAAAAQANAANAAGNRGGRGGRGAMASSPTNGPQGGQQPGGARVASGPAGGSRGPAGGVQVQTQVQQQQARAGAPNVQVQPAAQRQQVQQQQVPAQARPAVPAAVPSAQDNQAFANQLAAASPDDRKNMIGERLYALISRSEPERAGKITGMLLDGMDDSELLHLLESSPDLLARVNEALEVLRQHDLEVAAGKA